MASTQVEIASSCSPFGCVSLKDHNPKERRKGANPNLTQKSQTNFQRNLKMLVKDHFQSCISISGSGSNVETSKNNSCLQSTGFGCWGSRSSNHNNQTSSNKGNNGVIDDEPSLSYLTKRQSQTLGHCGVQQEQEMITATIQTQSHETTDHVSLSNCSTTDVSVSSLVKIWRGIEAEAKNSQCNKGSGYMEGCMTTTVAPETNSVCSSSRSTYEHGCTPLRTPVSTFQQLSYEPVTKDSMQGCTSDLKPLLCTSQHEKQHHQQSQQIDQLQHQQQKQQQDIVSLRGGEGNNVVDKVKTWINTYQMKCDQSCQEQQPLLGECLNQSKTKMDVREQSLVSSPVISSPKLRGRQAIADLFMKMERERYKEVESLTARQAVTKFAQRGRIQALLRLKILRREASIQEQPQPTLESNLGGSNKSKIKATIHNLRERFSATNMQDTINKRNTHKESITTVQEAKIAITSTQSFEQTSYQEEINVDISRDNSVESSQDEHCYGNNSAQLESHAVEKDQLLLNSTREVIREIQEQIFPFNVKGQETSYEKGDVNLKEQDVITMTSQCSNWNEEDEVVNDEELDDNNQQEFEANLDWVTDIARPRAYWEDCRQARYNEILDTQSKDKDIRQLIERGNVSSILASDFREKMDQILKCSIQRTITPMLNNSVIEEQHNEEDRQIHTSQGSDHGKEDEEEYEERELTSNLEESQDVSDYDKTSLSSKLPSDSCQEDESNEEDANHFTTTYLQQYQSNNNQDFSSNNISTIDAEFLYDLRKHMELLHQEIFELQKSITSCTNMQVMLQNSIKNEVSAAISQLGQEKQKYSYKRHPKSGCCYICYDKNIDSLLYRCGHMCTCFSCANELQWSSGKCPICRAQIIDVVRTYFDT